MRFAILAICLLLLLFPTFASLAQTTSLDALGQSVEELADRVGRSVVEVRATGLTAPGREHDSAPGQSTKGSGVILSADGYVITNAHLIAKDQKITVALFSGQESRESDRSLPAGVVGIDRETDLALLKVDQMGLPFLRIHDAEPLRQGQLVLAVGNPLDRSNSISAGPVRSQYSQVDERDPVQYIRSAVSINAGSSGGALVDTQGRLVGINTFLEPPFAGCDGFGVAIPARVVRHVYQQLLKGGPVRRGAIGVSAQNLSDVLAQGLSLATASGVLITDVAPGGPADRAGLESGDIVIAVDGIHLTDTHQLEGHVYATSKGELITVDIQRGSSRQELRIVGDQRADTFDGLAPFLRAAQLVDRLGSLGSEISLELSNKFNWQSSMVFWFSILRQESVQK